MGERPSALRMQFEDLAQQEQADTLGMWTFLATEVLFFGGLFLVYAVYRWYFPGVFRAASQELNLVAGSFNTTVLLTSSFVIALADNLIEKGKQSTVRWLVVTTAVLGIVFLGIKAFEYHEEFSHHLVPFIDGAFHWDKADPLPTRLFFNLYFVMTGLHALHLLIGCSLLLIIALPLWTRIHPQRLPFFIKVSALYWHFVDIVWVFLFPLLYLVR